MEIWVVFGSEFWVDAWPEFWVVVSLEFWVVVWLVFWGTFELGVLVWSGLPVWSGVLVRLRLGVAVVPITVVFPGELVVVSEGPLFGSDVVFGEVVVMATLSLVGLVDPSVTKVLLVLVSSVVLGPGKTEAGSVVWLVCVSGPSVVTPRPGPGLAVVLGPGGSELLVLTVAVV